MLVHVLNRQPHNMLQSQQHVVRALRGSLLDSCLRVMAPRLALALPASVVEGISAGVREHSDPSATQKGWHQRNLSTSSTQKPDEGTGEKAPDDVDTEDATASTTTDSSQLQQKLLDKEKEVEELAAKVDFYTDQLKRSLADMENLRQRTSRQIDQAEKFAVQGFAKSMLDVADNLQRALESVPEDAIAEGAALEADKASSLLRGLYGGVRITESILLQAFKNNGLEMYNPMGDKFDPNLHNALFELPDPTKEPGHVGAVTKRGYTLKGRVLRPAEVGVTRAP